MQKVDLRSHLDQRLPIGLGLLALAAWCIWQWDDPDEAGWLIFGLYIGFFGLLAVAERRFAVVDEHAGVLTNKRGLIFAVTLGSVALTEVKCVELTLRLAEDDGKKGRSTRYRLRVTGPKSGVLAHYQDEWHARRAAERLAAALRVPFDNRVYGRRSVRKSDELDLPLAERWRASGKIKERPVLPQGSQLEIDDQTTRIRVRFAAETGSRWLIGAVVAFYAVAAALSYPHVDEPGEYLLFYGVALFAVLFFGFVLLAFSGRSRLTFTDRSVAFRQGLAPRERSIELQAIEEMIPGWDAIYLVGDAKMLAIDWPTSDQDRDFLKAFVACEIARRHTRGGEQ